MSNTALTLPTSWTTTGSGTAWTNPSRITADDGSSASTSATATQDLLGSSYGFTIPTWATIDGIEFSAKWQMPDGAAGTCTWYIYKWGSRVATTFTGWFWVWSATTVTKGSSTELWGTTWTAAQINASNFWTALAISGNGSGNWCNVDWHKVTIYFTYVGVRYWVGGTATWDATAWTKWSTTSGGAGWADVPNQYDDVFFDANSTGVITVSSSTVVGGFSLANFAGSFYSATPASNTLEIYGSVTLKANTQNQIAPTFWQVVRMDGAGTHTITTNGGSFWAVNIQKYWVWTYTMQDDWTETDVWPLVSGRTSISLVYGTFDCNGYNLTHQYIVVNWATVYFGDGTITSIGAGIAISGSNVAVENADFVINNPNGWSSSLVGWGKTYKSLTITGDWVWPISIFSSNTFTDFTDEITNAHTLKFSAWTTNTFSSFNVNGTLWNEITITTANSSTATHNLVNASWSDIVCNYLNIQHSIATPANTWKAYLSVDNQSVATAWSWWDITITPLWTPRPELYEEYDLYSTNILPDNPRYYPYSPDIWPEDKWYFIYSEIWNTPTWISRT